METTISSAANSKLLADGYAAFARGDLEALNTLFRPDMVWRAQRLGTLSGDHIGRAAVFAFFAQTMELTQGTFSVVPEEISPARPRVLSSSARAAAAATASSTTARCICSASSTVR